MPFGRRCDNGGMNKTITKLGPFVVVQGEAEGATRCWVERGGKRISGYSDAEEASEYAELLYDEYMDDADVDTGE